MQEQKKHATTKLYSTDRVPLLPEVEKIGNSFNHRTLPAGFYDTYHSGNSGYGVEDDSQVERYALASYMIQWAFERSLTNKPSRPPYGLITGKRNLYHPGYLVREPRVLAQIATLPAPDQSHYMASLKTFLTKTTQAMELTLDYDLEQEIVDIQTLPLSHFKRRIFERLSHLTSLHHSIFYNSPDAAYRFIIQGNGTATMVLRGILGVIPELVKQKEGRYPTVQELSEVGSNSYSLIMKLANGSRAVVPRTLDRLNRFGLTDYFDSKNMFLVTDHITRHRVEIIAALVERVRSETDLSRVRTTGCPAVMPFHILNDSSNITGKSQAANVIRAMLDWELDILRSAA